MLPTREPVMLPALCSGMDDGIPHVISLQLYDVADHTPVWPHSTMGLPVTV
jgi:hypothetical protein